MLCNPRGQDPQVVNLCSSRRIFRGLEGIWTWRPLPEDTSQGCSGNSHHFSKFWVLRDGITANSGGLVLRTPLRPWALLYPSLSNSGPLAQVQKALQSLVPVIGPGYGQMTWTKSSTVFLQDFHQSKQRPCLRRYMYLSAKILGSFGSCCMK